MSKKNILEEAIADSKQLRNAAYKNAEALLLENMKKDLREMVEEQINEMAADPLPEGDDPEDKEEGDEEDSSEGTEMDIQENEDFDLGDLEDEEEEEDTEEDFADDESEEDDTEEGLSEADLHEALAIALNEVEHGKMGDLRPVGPDEHEDPITGADYREAGWEEKTAPAKKDFTVKENAYKARIAKLVAENVMLKKANAKLKRTVNEVHLFNTKLHYAHKLMNKHGLSNSVKEAIIKKMDDTRTVAEAKTLYESLELALGALSERKAVKKQTSLSEALGIHGTSQGKNVSQLNENVTYREPNPFDPERMKVLAGVKK